MATFTAPDATTLVYDAYEPERPPRPERRIVVTWSEHAGRYAWLGARLRDAGLATYVADLRGHGRSGGHRAHLSRFSQLLGDLQAFRRVVRGRTDAPQVLLGHSFGALVVLRYLETQPTPPPAAAVVSGPFLGLPYAIPLWKQLAERLLGDLWPGLALPADIDIEHLSRDPTSNAAYRADPVVHKRTTLGAWREIRWAQRAVAADSGRVESPVLFLLAGEDRIVDVAAARAFADSLRAPAAVRWYGEMYHEILNDPQRERVVDDVLAFLADPATAGTRAP
jgi:alpha-beta hydrolase superfamily lysophospholipase